MSLFQLMRLYIYISCTSIPSTPITLFCLPLAILGVLFLFSVSLLFFLICKSCIWKKHMMYSYFWMWLIWLNMLFIISIHFPTNDIISFLMSDEYACIYVSTQLSSVDGRLSWFRLRLLSLLQYTGTQVSVYYWLGLFVICTKAGYSQAMSYEFWVLWVFVTPHSTVASLSNICTSSVQVSSSCSPTLACFLDLCRCDWREMRAQCGFDGYSSYVSKRFIRCIEDF